MSSDVKTELHRDDLSVDLTGKVAIVTGSSSGIGSAIVTRYAQSGAIVVIDYPSAAERENAEQVVRSVERLGAKALCVRSDISVERDADALVAAAVKAFGGVDILVNNAGIEHAGAVVDLDLDIWEHILRVNLTGTFLCSRAAARAMIDRARGGRIINISSVHEDLAMPRNAAYTASKGGVRMLMRTLALELAEHRITVNDIAPGAIATRINRDVRSDDHLHEELLREIPLGRVADPAEVAGLACYLASDAAAYCTAATFVIDGGLMRATKGL